jgi:polysaccharide biosynthesis transport protein
MDEEIIGVGDYIAILKRRKMQLVIPAAIIFILSLGLALGLPSVYRAQATILIEQQEIPSELVRSTVTSYAGERIQVISQRVMTSENLGKIIENYGLYSDDRNSNSLTLLAEDLRSDIELDMISADVVDPRSGRPTTATIAFTLAYSSKIPRIAQKVTNELVSLYLDENLRQRTQSAFETSNFLSAEADRLNKEIDELETLLAEFKEKNINNLPELQQLNIQLMERNERGLADTEQQLRNLAERKIYLQPELAQISPSTDLFNSSGNRVMGTEDRVRALETEYVSMATRYTDDHPTMIKLRGEIEALSKELSGSNNSGSRIAKSDNPTYVQLSTQLEAAESEISSLEILKNELKEKIKDFERRLIQSPQVEREYKDLMRDYENAVAKYQEVKSKQLEAQMAESLERERKGERFSLIEPPQLPEEPFKPNRLAIVLIGIFLSISAGVGNVAIRENIDSGIYGSKGIYTVTQSPPLAVIPYIETDTDIKLRSKRRILAVAVGVSAVFIFVILFHIFLIPLDILWFMVIRKFGIEAGGS